MKITTAPKRDSRHWKNDETTWADLIEMVRNPSDHKECGNYILGHIRRSAMDHPPGKKDCVNYHRNKESVFVRSQVSLDADTPKLGFVDTFEMILGYTALVHSTYSSTPDDKRYRVIILCSRDMTPYEYRVVADYVMQKVGRHQFDEGSLQPERYMFRPSAQHPEWYEHYEIEGKPLDVDWVVANHKLPDNTVPEKRSRKRDPFALQGVVGAFNRVYDLESLVAAYDLPYESLGEERWRLVGTHSEAGMGSVSDGIYFSHHSTDPAGGEACSAFDLVRLHRFADLDAGVAPGVPVNRKPSHEAMLDLAAKDPAVIAEMVGADFSKSMDDVIADNDWRINLVLNKRTGKFVDCIGNWDLVRDNSSVFQGLYINEFSLSVETDRDLPWRKLANGGPVFTGTDRAALCHAIERDFGIRPARSLMDELVDTKAQQRRVNPVRDYLADLEWDGVARLETCLPGVIPTPYTRMVARKSLVAAVARMMEPGIKWDHTMVLFGVEGLGKSWWISRMARGYSASLGRIGDKDTLLTMTRSWIMTSDEGYSLRKADSDVQKEFLTRTEDVFRMPYDRDAIAHPRHCVIWGTTNDEVFLRRQEGNRRYLIVRCTERVNFDLLTDHYIDQVWAEAMHLYKNGERLYLLSDEGELATGERESFTEEDALDGVIQQYLNTMVPEDWDLMSPGARITWLQNRADRMVPKGTHRITQTCSAQLWVEALGRRFGEHKRTDLLDINSVMKRLPGWTSLPGRHRIPGYGPQLVFEREDLI